jgi:hypothetical protein
MGHYWNRAEVMKDIFFPMLKNLREMEKHPTEWLPGSLQQTRRHIENLKRWNKITPEEWAAIEKEASEWLT